MKHLITGVAAIALMAGAAMAQGNGNGNGNGGKPKAEHAQSMKADRERGNSSAMRSAMDDRRGDSKDVRGAGKRAEKRDHDDDDHRAHKVMKRAEKAAERRGADRDDDWDDGDRRWSDRVERRGGRVLDDGRRVFDSADSGRWWGEDDRRGLIDGCPPGLAKKNNGCMPPGLAKKDDRRTYASYRPDWWGLGSLGLGDGRYFYDDGYLMRLDGNRIAGFIPLLGGALSPGNPWPDYYGSRPVPEYYVDYFGLGPADSYRYADDVLFRVDPETSAITSIAALLTGNDLRVGQPMPSGYDVYNVPYPYRSQYQDGPDSMYRYSDGYVYQVDPKTRLIAAAIELLAG